MFFNVLNAMIKIFISVAMMGFMISLTAQTITILDKETKQPVELATLICENTKIYAVTNADGQADITKFKDAKKIEIRSVGYRTLYMSYQDIEDFQFIVEMEFSNLNLDEVVISATKWRQVSGNVPSKIISITPKEVALLNPQTAADLLSISGKVYIQKSQQGGGSPMIRGFATNRLVYTIDGVRMNTAIFRGGNIQNVINLDPFATESTEVLFGPGSVIYGSDAIGGVMSFQTLSPQFSLTDKALITGKALTRYSSANNENTAHFNINIGWKKWAIITSISSWDYDHLRQGSHGPEEYLKPYFVQRQDSGDHIIYQEDPLLQIPSAYSQMNLMQKVRFKPNDKWDLQYGFHFSETSSYGRYDRHNRIKDGLPRYAEWNYGPQKWTMNNLNITHSSNAILFDQLVLRLAYQYFEESRIDRSLNKTDRTNNTEQVDAYSANIDFSKASCERNTIFYGFEYVLNDVHSTGAVTNILTQISEPGPSRYPQASWTSMAIYINDEFKPTDKFTLQTGIRYNYFIMDASFDTTFYPFPFTTANLNNGALTGSIGGGFHPTQKWSISTNFGTAFRSPNVDDLGKVFDSEPGAVTVPNPDLEAEYAYNVDVGIAKVFDDFLKLDATAYYTILRNAMVRRDFQLNGFDSIMYDGTLSQVQAIQNAAVARVYGLQGGLEMKLPAQFTLSSDINYQIGEEEMADGTISPSRHAAPLFGVTRLSFNSNKLNLQFYSMYQGERKYEDLAVEEQGKDEIYAKDENGNNYAPAWITLNVSSMYSFSDYLSITAGIENLTDQRYRLYSSGISAPGRNFFLTLKASF